MIVDNVLSSLKNIILSCKLIMVDIIMIGIFKIIFMFGIFSSILLFYIIILMNFLCCY